jgi:hypothetical protein
LGPFSLADTRRILLAISAPRIPVTAETNIPPSGGMFRDHLFFGGLLLLPPPDGCPGFLLGQFGGFSFAIFTSTSNKKNTRIKD